MKKDKSLFIKLFFLVVIGVTIFVIVRNPEQLKNVVFALSGMHKGYIALSLLLIALTWMLESLVLYFVSQRTLSLWASVKIVMAGQFFNAITPFATGGQPAQLYMIHKENVPISSGASMLTRKFIIFQSVLVFFSLLVVLFESEYFLTRVPDFAKVGLLGFTLNLLVIFGLWMISYQYDFTRRSVVRLVRFLRKFIKKTSRRKKMFSSISALRSYHLKMEQSAKKAPWFGLGVITGFQLISFFAIPVVISLGLHITEIDFIRMVSAAAFVSMVTSFIPLPGAAFGAEGSFYLFFGIFFHESLVLTALIIWRFVTFYLPLILGGLVVVRESMTMKL